MKSGTERCREEKRMSFTIYARMKKPGKQRRGATAPVSFELDKRPGDVRELITALTVCGVRDYNARKDEGQILPYLTDETIREKAAAGKVSFGVHGGNPATEEEAVENALQSFEDGIYRVFAGEEELTELNEALPWTEEMVFTFIRLTMLTG